MRFTDKVAESFIKVPTGLSPRAVGKVVTVRACGRDGRGQDLPETLELMVGVLVSYVVDRDGVAYTIQGNDNVIYKSHEASKLEFIVYEGD